MDPQKLFTKYYKKLTFEGILKSALCGVVAGLAALFLAAAVCWFFGYKGFWVLIVAPLVSAGIVGALVYFKKFRPTTRSIARRVDELGLEERLITMTELEGDPSYIAMRQREDAMQALGSVSADLIKIAVSVSMIVSLAVAGVCGLGSTTVYAMYCNGSLKSGLELIEKANEKAPNVFKVEYAAEEYGVIIGETEQEIYEGEDALAVYAVPEEGYIFVGWSDGNDSPYRVDLEITGNISVTALFEEAVDVDPSNDEDNDPDADDLPPLNSPSDDTQDNRDPSDNSSEDASGKWNSGDQYLDGETDYGSDLGDATDGAQSGANNGGGNDSGIIGDYFDGIQK